MLRPCSMCPFFHLSSLAPSLTSLSLLLSDNTELFSVLKTNQKLSHFSKLFVLVAYPDSCLLITHDSVLKFPLRFLSKCHLLNETSNNYILKQNLLLSYQYHQILPFHSCLEDAQLSGTFLFYLFIYFLSSPAYISILTIMKDPWHTYKTMKKGKFYRMKEVYFLPFSQCLAWRCLYVPYLEPDNP